MSPVEPLVFGIAPAHGVRAPSERVSRIARYLQTTLDRAVKGCVEADYTTLATELTAGRIDAAWLGAIAYARVAAAGVTALATSVRAGEPYYGAAIIVRKRASFSSIEDLRGAAAAWVDPHSAAGYVYPKVYLEQQVGDLGAFLGEQHFLGSHRAVCEAVARGWAGLGATYCTPDEKGGVVHSSWDELLAERADSIRILKILEHRIPGDAIAARPGLDERLAEAVAEAFLALPEASPELSGVFAADRFTPARPEYYREAIELVTSSPNAESPRKFTVK